MSVGSEGGPGSQAMEMRVDRKAVEVCRGEERWFESGFDALPEKGKERVVKRST